MPYAPFCKYFPKIAEDETRTIVVTVDSELPKGNYSLIEMYCDEENCDCRRVMLNVISGSQGTTHAVIAYGWETRAFYEKWMGDNDKLSIDAMMGPTLNLGSPETKLAPILLNLVSDMLKTDKNYVARLKRHYEMFKESLDYDH